MGAMSYYLDHAYCIQLNYICKLSCCFMYEVLNNISSAYLTVKAPAIRYKPIVMFRHAWQLWDVQLQFIGATAVSQPGWAQSCCTLLAHTQLQVIGHSLKRPQFN